MIRCQWPRDFLSKELFDSLSSFIIPKNELQAHTITVNCHGYKISGFPTYLHDKKYPRNYLLFNLCIVSFPWSRTVQFEPVVRKLSQFFVNLEKESVLLSGSEGEEVEVIERMLEQVYTDLNTGGGVSEVVCGQNSLQLSVQHQPGHTAGHTAGHSAPLTSVSAHHVPVLVTRDYTDHWDLTTTQIMPHIDGFNHIAKIASLADVGTSLVVACVQNLVYHSVVKIISIFQYSNVYTVTHDLTRLSSDQQFRQDLMTAITRRDAAATPRFRDIFTFISSFSYGCTVKDVCGRMCPVKLGIYEARLVQFCVMRGVLRRVHRYPVWSGEGDKSVMASSWFTGEHNTDQICVGAGLSEAALDKIIEEDNNVVVICK